MIYEQTLCKEIKDVINPKILAKNNRFKKVNLLIDLNSYLDKSKKNLYLDLINSNIEYIKNNKVSKEIEENINFFKTRINNL